MAAAIATRYAQALVDVVTGAGPAAVGPEKTKAELEAFAATFKGSLELRNVLLSPAVPPVKKKVIITEIGARLGISPTTRNFLFVLADHRRLELLEEMKAAFEALLDERLGIVRAGVACAQPIDAAQQSQLAAQLGRLTGKQVRLDCQVDPALLGGLVARIGSTIYDGSVRGQLQALERRLAAE